MKIHEFYDLIRAAGIGAQFSYSSILQNAFKKERELDEDEREMDGLMRLETL